MKSKSDPPSSVSRRALLVGAPAGAMLIGSFAEASTLVPGPASDIVQTSGFGSTRRGAALYVADPAVDRAYVEANPLTGFISTDGRGFRLSLDQTITPFMFGATGVAGFNGQSSDFAALPDDSAALQAFFDFCASRRVESANWGGVYGITRGLIVGGAFGEVESAHADTASFEGSLFLAVKSNINGAVLSVRTRRQVPFGPIGIAGPWSHAYAPRLFDIGILIEDRAQALLFSTVYVAFARVAGVLAQTLSATPSRHSNIFNSHFGNCFFYGCGSGSPDASSYLATRFSGKANAGTASTYEQSTSMTVAAFPPEIVSNYGIPIFARIAGEIYAVIGIDRSSRRLTLYPWVDLRVGSAGAVEYLYGGGMVIVGGDTAMQTGKISAQICAAGLVNASLYNGRFVGVFQDNAIGLVIGKGPGEAAVGGSLDGYWESNQIDILWNATSVESAYFTITSQHALNLGKIRGFQFRHGDNRHVHFNYAAGGHLQINAGDFWHTTENIPHVDGAWAFGRCRFDRPAGAIVPLHHDSPRIDIIHFSDTAGHGTLYAPRVADYTDKFGYRARNFQITGTGPGNKPTGTITVTPGGADKKINGGAAGANAEFTGFTGPVTMQIALDPADPNNCLASIMSGK